MRDQFRVGVVLLADHAVRDRSAQHRVCDAVRGFGWIGTRRVDRLQLDPAGIPAAAGRSRVSRRRGLGPRLARGVVALALAFLAVSVVPVLLFALAPVPSSAFMLRYQVASLLDERERPALRYDWVGWGAISDAAKLAVIAAEDQRFPEHFGFDVAAIEKAIDYNHRGGRARGASTISQQTAKNLFLWPGRSWLRKGLEVGFTLLIETLWTKQRVLTVYLNVAEFGEGVYGVEAAAQAFFGKPAAALGPYEASLLAAVLPNPKRLHADRPSAYVASRAAWIRGQMRQLGVETLERL